MFDFNTYFADRNAPIEAAYRDARQKLTEAQALAQQMTGEKQAFGAFFEELTAWLLKLVDYEARLLSADFYNRPFEELLAEHRTFYAPILPENYAASFGNPAYAVSVFGDRYGQLFSALFSMCRSYLDMAFEHRRYELNSRIETLLDLFSYCRDSRVVAYDPLLNYIRRLQEMDMIYRLEARSLKSYDPAFSYYTDVLEKTDLTDLRYLFRLNEYISDNQVRTARFLNDYPQPKIEALAHQLVNAYIRGFTTCGKDAFKRPNPIIGVPVGLEVIARAVCLECRRQGLTPIIEFSAVPANKQFSYDHKFDNALWLDPDYVSLSLVQFDMLTEKFRPLIQRHSGYLLLGSFGEQPFEPIKTKERLSLSKEQLKLHQELQNTRITTIHQRYAPGTETSFSISAFPTPEIGPDFEAIFEEMMDINQQDAEQFEIIQKKLIDVLDTAAWVHVKGCGENKTDIQVSLSPLANPSNETLFINCGADINVPAGEVFTSPQLKGTTGILHFEDIKLRSLRYVNLRLTLKDGYVESYDCDNFPDPADGRKYIRENLFFPHDTLPLGEFAIGTNTRAYRMAKRYNIIGLLPILIIEKMGPHFAIGDTCFGFREETVIRNPIDNKLFIAMENERTALRHKSREEAYTYCHTDMTLPFESIAFITAVRADGTQVDILRDGRFVVPGTEVLNAALDA